MLAITAKTLLTPVDAINDPLLLIDDSTIAEIASRASRALPKCRTVDFGDAVLAPGLIDIHMHGAAGSDVMQSDPSTFLKIESFLSNHGVTNYFPTNLTAPVYATLAALERLAARIESPSDRTSARPLGIHLEGPFISHARRGVHPPEDLIPPSIQVFERFWQASRGQIRMITIAPELDGALELIAEAIRREVCVSLGHSDADLASTRAAVRAGAHHATHTFNAMRPLGHRDPGIIGEVLSNSAMSADIIADGIHVDPAVVKIFLSAKGPDATVLITDATAATGMPDGRYQLGSLNIEVKDGRCLANGVLAGSVLMLDRAVRNVMEFGSWELRHAVQAATLNPARTTGLNGVGQLAAGCRADIVVMSPSGEVANTIVGGKIFQAGATA